jgi:hypothetical protein
MALFHLTAAAQQGQACANLGRRFFLREEQAADVARELVSLLSEDFQKRIADREGLGAVLHCLASYDYARHCETAGALTMVVARGPGRLFLRVLGREAGYPQATIDRLAVLTGAPADTIVQMLPHVAVLLAGVLKLETSGMLQRIVDRDGAISNNVGDQDEATRDPFAVLGARVGAKETAKRVPQAVSDVPPARQAASKDRVT